MFKLPGPPCICLLINLLIELVRSVNKIQIHTDTFLVHSPPKSNLLESQPLSSSFGFVL
jgi:hypothetical protein